VLHLVVGLQYWAQGIISRQRMGPVTPPGREPVVDVQHVDRLPAQPPQARLDRRADGAGDVVHLRRRQPHLRRNDD
jgi:hypothetical protein